jgi:hypothetical protein
VAIIAIRFVTLPRGTATPTTLPAPAAEGGT